MQLRRELTLMMGTLVGLNVLLAFGVISLLVRMGPAIERILQENVRSIVAAEGVLAEIADIDSDSVSPERRARIEEGLARARSNQTEPAELMVLDALERELDAALSARGPARARFVSDLRELIRINRDAMGRGDLRARRLGSAGAWAAVLVGVFSFALSLVVLGRMRNRFVNPLLDLHAALEAARAGEGFRRCQARDAPVEVRQVLDSVNRLLDERLAARQATEVGGTSPETEEEGESKVSPATS